MSSQRRASGPTGVGVLGPSLSDEVKEHLQVIAQAKAVPQSDVGAFVAALGDSASLYWASKSLQDEALPATVRDELKAVHQACMRMVDRLNKLGGTSRHLLYTEGGSGTHKHF